MIEGRSLEQWKSDFPLINGMTEYKEVFWKNETEINTEDALKSLALTEADVFDAEARLKRFAPYIADVFPETSGSNGVIESPLTEVGNMKHGLEELYGTPVDGDLYVKEDNKLAVSGSIKARGGIYEVLNHAEKLAIEAGMITEDDDYKKFDSDAFKEYFSQFSIVCGSTGNLGLSIGIMGAAFGFKVTIHMSSDARAWKKEMLRSKGVKVVEHSEDYSKAVEQGRDGSLKDPKSYFVDDENSKTLFLGYAVAASRLKTQLEEAGISVNEKHPLNVYLPCGVGGGPGGIAFGLKIVFGNDVHCYFAEPTHAPCMLLGMMTDYHDKLSVGDFGIDNKTAADGLAVGRASGFVGKLLREMISGAYTVSDETLFKLLALIYDKENIKLEPSALAGIPGPVFTENKQGTHIAWSTGGDMVPDEVWQEYYDAGDI